MSRNGMRWPVVTSALTLALALGVAGCGGKLDDTYGTSRGPSVNGTGVLSSLLKKHGHEVRVGIRLNDELANWSDGIIRFATYPGPPGRDEASWFRTWLGENPGRWLIYVPRDFDTVPEYWKTVRDDPNTAREPDRKSEAEENREQAADWPRHLPPKAKSAASGREWFDVDTAWTPPRVCQKLTGPWAEGVSAASAALTVHEPLKKGSGTVLLEGDGKPLVIEKKSGGSAALFIANGSFLLNEALINPARRPLADRVVDWVDERGNGRIAMVEGSFLLGSEEPPSLWNLLARLPYLQWIAAQVCAAALMATLARAPRLGRPRPAPRSEADRPVAHSLALGALLSKTTAEGEAVAILQRYRGWRHPREGKAIDSSKTT